MTISSTIRKAGPYAGDGATTVFSFSFKVFAQTDLWVVYTDASGVESDWVLGTHYSVTLNPNQDTHPGGTITATTAPATGTKITISSRIPATQLLDLPNNSAWYPDAVENALDKLTIIDQQIDVTLARCVKVGISSSQTPDELIESINTAAANAAASASAAAASAANAEASYDSFDDRYLGAKASDPALDNDGNPLIVGALYFNTTNNEMRVYTGTVWTWLNSASIVQESFTATGGQTTFTVTGGYDVGNVAVYRNGLRLSAADFTATDGATVVLASPASAGDVVMVEKWNRFAVTDAISKLDINAKGDLIVGTSDNNYARLAVGSNGRALAADSAASTGLKWMVVSPIAPQGRLTLASGKPVMDAEEANKQTIYYTPYLGNIVPLYDGSGWSNVPFTELSIAMAGSTNWPTSNNFDVFVYDDGGTLRLVTGAAWTDATTRAEALTRVGGILVNAAAFTGRYSPTGTVSIAAQRATYVGTFRTIANGQTTWELGGNADGGKAAFLFVWNYYNRVEVGVMVGETTNSWVYNTIAWRPLNNSAGNRASYVAGFAEDKVTARVCVAVVNSGSYTAPVGIGVDSTTVNSALYASSAHSLSGGACIAFYEAQMRMGRHYLQALESAASGSGGTTTTWFGDNGAAAYSQAGMTFTGRF